MFKTTLFLHKEVTLLCMSEIQHSEDESNIFQPYKLKFRLEDIQAKYIKMNIKTSISGEKS